MPRKQKEYRLNVKMKKDMYEFFQKWCESNADNMSAYIKRHILEIKRRHEEQRRPQEQEEG